MARKRHSSGAPEPESLSRTPRSVDGEPINCIPDLSDREKPQMFGQETPRSPEPEKPRRKTGASKSRKPRRKPSAGYLVANILTALFAVAGLALILYPSIADAVNRAVNGEAIDTYKQATATLGESRSAEMLDAAALFNEDLARDTPYIGRLSSAMMSRYETLLDPTGTGVMAYLEVPKAKIHLAVYHGTSESVLQMGVGHLEASSLPVPGKSTHTVLTGHSGLPSARLFTDLDQLRPGDTFTLTVLGETYTYRVTEMKRVLPEALETLRIETGKELCTLVTCTPYGVNTHRLAVTGERVPTPEKPAPRPSKVKRALKSSWNRTYVFLPPVLFAGVLVAIILIRRHRRRKRAASIQTEEGKL